MLAGTVVGNIVSTQKHHGLVGLKLLLVELTGEGQTVVAADTLGAGRGERVLLATGSAARRALGDDQIPVDTAIVGIIDRLETSE